jgi:hypothetical protein
MKFIPDSIARSVAGLALRGQKNAPTLLFGAGVVSMVGSTVLACRATLKFHEVLDQAEQDLKAANQARETRPEDYSENDKKKDVALIYGRGIGDTIKLYGPAVLLGGVGIVCLTKSQSILKDRNAALTAAYVAIDSAFSRYRERVVEKYGEDEDRYFRYGQEEIDIIDEETGKVVTTLRASKDDEPGMYARWFDEESTNNYTAPPFDEYNWVFLRDQQNWCNDILASRGHLFLNEVYGCLGLDHTTAGSLVGWVYDHDNDRGDNFVDFGCWGQKDDRQPLDFYNGREYGILLDFNVDGPIWHIMDELSAKKS